MARKRGRWSRARVEPSSVSLNGLNRQSTAPCASSADGGLVGVRGDEDDRDRPAAARQLPLELRARSSPASRRRGSDTGPADAIGREELLRRRERLDREAELPQQVGQRLAHGLVVIDDRHE